MERFAPVDDQYDPAAVEERVFEYWDDIDAYEKTVEHRADGEDFFFVDGPPYTSGSAHMGHAWNKSLKDVYIRYKRMCGYDVTDRPGYDMHGLPIETKVEEEKEFRNKKDIEAFGVENFVDACREFAETSLEGLQEDFKSFGVWMDWDNPYRTVEPEYMEAAWWGFASAHERDLVEQGQRSITQCPRCETAIANNEVEYEDVEDPSIYVKFDLADREGNLVVWTTTPWTIPANTFVAVDGEGTYVGVEATRNGQTELLYVAEPKVDEVLRAGRYDDYEIVEELSGEDLLGWEYDHPLREKVPDAPDGDGAGQVYEAPYVDTEGEGTGLVHSAPGHGEEDFERGRELGLEIFCPVGPDGVYDEAAGTYEGQFVKDADDEIIDDLEARGRMLAAETTTHSYGHCWRCDTGIVQIVTDQWFITITDIKDDLLANIDDSEWYPHEARENRFRNFVEEAPDWNVSRQRYWGTPVPIWLPSEDADGEPVEWSGDMDDAIVVGDREELADAVDQEIDPETVDLHKDTVDDLTITEDGVTYERVPDVFDVWLDSAVATWGTIDYPSETEAFDELWPADLIIEAHDQTRGWFWSQLGMGTAAVGASPYERVVMHGHALMPDGRAMSKSRDIRVDPGEVIDDYGADPMRAFLLSLAARGEDMNFSYDGTEEMQRRLNILWNVFRFPLPYMRMDGFSPRVATESQRSEGGDAAEGTGIDDVTLDLADEWVLSRLQTVEAEATEAMEEFRQDDAIEGILDFVVEDVSRYYVQLVRERMWEEDDSESKRAAYATLYRVLREVVALLAPFTPFVAEEIYGTLTGESEHPTVHMCDWPTVDDELRDPTLEDEVTVARAVEEAGSNARQQAERKLRWPVTRVVIDTDSDDVTAAIEAHTDLVADRLNARTVEIVGGGDAWGELAYSAEADMSELGPAFGDDAGRVMNALNEARVDEASLDTLEAAVSDALGESVALTDEMVSFRRETPEGVASTEFEALGGHGVVYVDTTLTEDIESEGYAREVIRRVQEMRKDLELDLEERIRLDLAVADERIDELVREHEQLIAEEVRADEFGDVEDGHRKTWSVEGVEMEIAIATVETAEADD
ncbi:MULTISPECIES: isoleucine--tRNA ligase [Halomicrobium]|uniref:Isoleucine--tRNA ligase n=2 Tax=Halomicrobium mukohataei TaxID=57705 RepID=C7P1H4_HALMD|nr:MULTISPECIES: isoleucine--tRNA ligase [Halomicrobium]ACV47182.1 isoleucyl-tRNA synthetase [Halomicrobium mukohataei DSM 12286]QCD65659.1 isoleucine--tRNA ligase [Halomicrobium mukohataei]QFR20465.1 isoleucine--tRNA ligase [Halomicrobium sp. ZPS1]